MNYTSDGIEVWTHAAHGPVISAEAHERAISAQKKKADLLRGDFVRLCMDSTDSLESQRRFLIEAGEEMRQAFEAGDPTAAHAWEAAVAEVQVRSPRYFGPLEEPYPDGQ